MRSLLTRSYPKLYAVVLALGLIMVVLQQIYVPPTLASQHSAVSSNQQAPQHSDNNQCAADCISTLQHCCLYTLSPNQPLSVFISSSVPSSVLVYFFNSRPITPQTPPPKAA